MRIMLYIIPHNYSLPRVLLPSRVSKFWCLDSNLGSSNFDADSPESKQPLNKSPWTTT